MIIKKWPQHRPAKGGGKPSDRQVLYALDWVRNEMMYKGSPDFVRERVYQDRVQALVARLLGQKSDF